MKKFTLFSFLAFAWSITSFAAAWNYGVEPAGAVRGGRMKIVDQGRSGTYRKMKLKYKLETAVGYKEDFVPYNLPIQIFDGKFLSELVQGKTVSLGSAPHGWLNKTVNFSIQRTGNRTYVLISNEAQIRFSTPAASTAPWTRVEVRAGGVTLKGNLTAVTGS